MALVGRPGRRDGEKSSKFLSFDLEGRSGDSMVSCV